MEKRTFLLSCAAFAASLSLDGAWRTLRAVAGQPSDSDARRILRLTRNYAEKFPLLSTKEVSTIVRQGKDRHLLISLQSREEYENGHVPGAMLFPPEDLASPDKLTDFAHKLPKNKRIILICPNGHISCAVMLFLRQLKLNAGAMAFGMDGWNRAYAGSGAYPGDIGGEISLSHTRMRPEPDLAPPVYSELDDHSLLVQKSHGRFLSEVEPAAIREGCEGLLFCLRRPEDYAGGHIPGSINIPSEAFLGGDKIITQIPREQKITLSCYVGHYSCGAALLLTQLGYDARSVEWGMAGWNNKHIGPILQSLNNDAALPVESGPGVLYMSS